MKDVAKTHLFYNHLSNPNAFDTRVIKSVLMAGADKTDGWNNGQDTLNVTTQALDLKTGAGAMNLNTTAAAYFFGTSDLPGNTGGLIDKYGWDSATINLGKTLEYVFAAPFTSDTALNVALNWFSVRGFDTITDTGSDIAFADLNLQVWMLDDQGHFATEVGESKSTYNNTEFLRFDSLAAGQYGLRVTYDKNIFDTSDTVKSETFGLSWYAIPEPSGMTLLFASWIVCLRRRRP